MANSKQAWCYDCWVRPANSGGVFCDGCEENLNDGVLLDTAGPWCAKCNNWPVSHRGDLCDDCLPAQRHLPLKPRKPAARKAPSQPKAKPVPSVEDEVTYLPARRQTGVPA